MQPTAISAKLNVSFTHHFFLVISRLSTSKPSITLSSCLSILACNCCSGGLRPSSIAATAASQIPSLSASQRRTKILALWSCGIKRATGVWKSKYSTITFESYRLSPSFKTSTGILPSGLCSFTGDSGSLSTTSCKTSSMCFSSATMRTLRA